MSETICRYIEGRPYFMSSIHGNTFRITDPCHGNLPPAHKDQHFGADCRCHDASNICLHQGFDHGGDEVRQQYPSDVLSGAETSVKLRPGVVPAGQQITRVLLTHRQTCYIKRTLKGNTIIDQHCSNYIFISDSTTWLQLITQRHMQDETRNI